MAPPHLQPWQCQPAWHLPGCVGHSGGTSC